MTPPENAASAPGEPRQGLVVACYWCGNRHGRRYCCDGRLEALRAAEERERSINEQEAVSGT